MRPLTAFFLACLTISSCTCTDEGLNELTPPHLNADPTSIDFGDVPVGVRATHLLRIRNTGEQTLEVSSTAIEGSMAFRAAGAPFLAKLDEERVLTVSFTPQSAGPASADLVVISNSETGERTVIPLTGNGVAGSFCGPCNMPPQARCLSATELLVYDSVGSCDEGECRYAARSITCPAQCIVDECVPPFDAGVTPIDASVPDSAVEMPDAAVEIPDAAVELPDAAVEERPDAGNPFDGPCGPPIIAPYVENGGPFGGFQSVDGTGPQQTIRITFNCNVNRVTVTIKDPDFPENAINAFYQGALVDSARFSSDGTPGTYTEDTQTVEAPFIDEVLLVPDPNDYVAYAIVTYQVP